MDYGGLTAILQLVAFFAAVDTGVAMIDDDSPVLHDNQTVKKNKTVNVGIIVDRHDNRSNSINRAVELTMTISNQTKLPAKMNPIAKETNLADSYELRNAFCSLVDRWQPIALIGTSQSSTYNIIESYCRALKMPMFQLSLTRENLYDVDSYVISMCPSFIEPVIDFIIFFQWDRIFYLFDSDDALWRLQKLYKAFHTPPETDPGRQFLVDAIRIPDVFNCREVLRKLDKNYNFDNKQIVVDLSSKHAYEMFLNQVIDVGMNRDGYYYILGTLDITSIKQKLWKSFTYGGVNMTGFQLINKNKWTIKQTVHMERLGEFEPSIEVALAVDAVVVLTTALFRLWNESKANRSLVFPFRRGQVNYAMSCSSDFDIGPLVLDAIKNVSLEGLSGSISFDEKGQRTGFSFDVFHLSYRSPLKRVGSWIQGKGLQTSLRSPLPPVLLKPKNRTRIITTVENAPFIQVKSNDNGEPLVGNDRFEGFCVDMIKILAERCNFTYLLRQQAHKQYGAKRDNGSWDGMIGELIRGDADIALASLTITSERSEVVRFTKPYMNTGISIMIKKPEKSKPGVLSFMEPLSYKVWGCIACGFFAVSFILYMVGRFSPFEWQEEGTNSAPSDTFSFVNTLWFSLGALMQQGPDIFPRSLSGRILGSAWWFFTLIIISSYTANLAAFLTFEKLTTPIDSADDLPKQTKIKYGCQKSGTTKEFFENSRVPVYKQMWSFMSQEQPSVFVQNSEKGWEKVIEKKGKYAFLLESAVNNYYNQKKPCKTMRVGRLLDHKGYGVATPKYSDLSRKMNIAVLEMAETGELFKLEQKWWVNKGECGATDSGDKGKSALNLSNVAGIFHILIGGLVLSMIISLSQIVFHAKIKPKKRQETYHVNTTRNADRRSHKNVTIEETPVVTCTESNGGDPHLITFEDTTQGETSTSIRHNLYS